MSVRSFRLAWAARPFSKRMAVIIWPIPSVTAPSTWAWAVVGLRMIAPTSPTTQTFSTRQSPEGATRTRATSAK